MPSCPCMAGRLARDSGPAVIEPRPTRSRLPNLARRRAGNREGRVCLFRAGLRPPCLWGIQKLKSKDQQFTCTRTRQQNKLFTRAQSEQRRNDARVNPIRSRVPILSLGQAGSGGGRVCLFSEGLDVGLHKIFVSIKAFVHERILPVLPLPIRIAHTIAILGHGYRAIYDPPPNHPFVCHTPYQISFGTIL